MSVTAPRVTAGLLPRASKHLPCSQDRDIPGESDSHGAPQLSSHGQVRTKPDRAGLRAGKWLMR